MNSGKAIGTKLGKLKNKIKHWEETSEDWTYIEKDTERALIKLINEAITDFPKKKKIYRYHIGGEYGTDVYEEDYSTKEIDDWKKEWLGEQHERKET